MNIASQHIHHEHHTTRADATQYTGDDAPRSLLTIGIIRRLMLASIPLVMLWSLIAWALG